MSPAKKAQRILLKNLDLLRRRRHASIGTSSLSHMRVDRASEQNLRGCPLLLVAAILKGSHKKSQLLGSVRRPFRRRTIARCPSLSCVTPSCPRAPGLQLVTPCRSPTAGADASSCLLSLLHCLYACWAHFAGAVFFSVVAVDSQHHLGKIDAARGEYSQAAAHLIE